MYEAPSSSNGYYKTFALDRGALLKSYEVGEDRGKACVLNLSVISELNAVIDCLATL